MVLQSEPDLVVTASTTDCKNEARIVIGNRGIFELVRRRVAAAPRSTSITVVDQLGAAIGSSVGLQRERNEDRACIARLQVSEGSTGSYLLALVCDGLGGMKGGEESAVTAVATIVTTTFQELSRGQPSGRAFVTAVSVANESIFRQFRGEGGTTLVGALIGSNETICISVGDSRIYGKAASGTMHQLSEDDNVAAEVDRLRAVPAANLNALEIAHHLTQFVGVGQDIRIQPLAPNVVRGMDRLVLASDGAWRSANGTFQKVLAVAKNARETVERAVHLSNWCGGVDNTSVVAILGPVALSNLAIPASPDGGGFLELWTPYEAFSIVIEARSSVPSTSVNVRAEANRRVEPALPNVLTGKKRLGGRKGRKERKRTSDATSPTDSGQKSARQEQLDIKIEIQDDEQDATKG